MEFFDRAYAGTPPWEIGAPQPEFVRRCDRGEIRGRVLDVGCGTGENAIYFARHGHPTLGIDLAPAAVRRAREKVAGRGLPLEFRVANVLELDLGRERFDTVTDSGLFHVFEDRHRPVYAARVRAALRPTGRLSLLCFSEREPTDWGGPRRVSAAELRSTFGPGWRALEIAPARFQTRLAGVTGWAWSATFERVDRGPSRPRAAPHRRRGPGRRARGPE